MGYLQNKKSVTESAEPLVKRNSVISVHIVVLSETLHIYHINCHMRANIISIIKERILINIHLTV
jgi:hypothetical protein